MSPFYLLALLSLPLPVFAEPVPDPLARPIGADVAALGMHDLRRAVLSDAPATRGPAVR